MILYFPQKQLVFRANWSYFLKACFLPVADDVAVEDFLPWKIANSYHWFHVKNNNYNLNIFFIYLFCFCKPFHFQPCFSLELGKVPLVFSAYFRDLRFVPKIHLEQSIEKIQKKRKIMFFKYVSHWGKKFLCMCALVWEYNRID